MSSIKKNKYGVDLYVQYDIIPHIINRKENMYHILQKIGDDYFCVSKVRKPIASFDQALEKVKALKVLDEGEGDSITYIITQKVGNE